MLPAGSVNQAIAGWSLDDALVVDPLNRLEVDAAGQQLVDGDVDVLDGEVEDRVGGRDVVGLRVDEGRTVVGEVNRQQAALLGDAQAEGLGIEPLGCHEVVDGETAVRRGVPERALAGALSHAVRCGAR